MGTSVTLSQPREAHNPHHKISWECWLSELLFCVCYYTILKKGLVEYVEILLRFVPFLLLVFGRCIKIINPIPITGSYYSRQAGLSLLDLKMFRRALKLKRDVGNCFYLGCNSCRGHMQKNCGLGKILELIKIAKRLIIHRFTFYKGHKNSYMYVICTRIWTGIKNKNCSVVRECSVKETILALFSSKLVK